MSDKMRVWLEVKIGGDEYGVTRYGPDLSGVDNDDSVATRMTLILLRDTYMELKAALERRLPPGVTHETRTKGVSDG